MLWRYACLLLLAASAACARQGANASAAAGQPTPQTADSVAAPANAEAQGAPLRFKGEIENLKVEMELRREGEALSGWYQYEGKKGRLTLKGTVAADGGLSLQEFDENGAQSGVFKGRWHGGSFAPQAQIEGEWSKPDGGGEKDFWLAEQLVDPDGPVKIETKVLKEDDKKQSYSFRAEYPQIINPSGENAVKFNRKIEDLVKKKLKDLKEGDGDGEDEADRKDVEQTLKETGREFDSNDEINCDALLATDSLISVRCEDSSFEGTMAHPSHEFTVVNFDLKQGRDLKLADLFKPGSNYLKAVSDRSIAALREWNKDSATYTGSQGQPYLEDPAFAEGARPKPENYQVWNLTQKGLAITFDYYQLGAYAAGAPSVLIPYDQLKDVLRPDGPLAPFVR